MSLSSLFFMFCFLPGTLIAYYIFPKQVRKYVLFLVSLAFYAMGAPDFFVLFFGLIAITVLMGRLINIARVKAFRIVFLVVGILVNLVSLVYYKYFGAGILPLGISFYTFKAISFLADVYKEDVELSGNPFEDALYLSFFGQIISGPITRRSEMNYVLDKKETRGEKLDMLSHGLFRFVVGFVKKILIADTLYRVVSEVFESDISNTSSMFLWLGSICFSLELYFDFSGYSDMAIGISNMFGYDIKENFDYPYTTESVAGFWRKWHISLSSWFKDYIYIPLGGSRTKHKWQTYFNLLAVWVLTGIWHGTGLQFIFWGLGYFVLISFERFTGLPKNIKGKFGRILYRAFALVSINILWVFFNADSLGTGLKFVAGMFFTPGNGLYATRALILMKEYGLFIGAAILFSMPVIPALEKKLEEKRTAKALYMIVSSVVMAVLFIISVSMVVAGQNNPFAYATF